MKSWAIICMLFLMLTACSLGGREENRGTEQEVQVEETAANVGDQIEKHPLRESVYEIVVMGGEPEGVAAALSAARNGKKTLLIERRDGLGGLFTYGEMNFIDFPKGIDNKWTSQGIFKEWHNQLSLYNSFGIEEAKSIFLKMAEAEGNLTLALSTSIKEVKLNKEGNSIEGVIVNDQNETYIVRAEQWIDATQDADFAVAAGVPYFIGGEDIGIEDKKMAVTLVLHYKNVDWNGVKQTVESRKFGYANMNDHVAWGFNDLHFDYKPVEDNTRLRGLNMAKIGDDVYINALQIFDVNGLDAQSINAGMEKGKQETNHILDFLKKEFPGFENAQIADYPPELYVRETRHILAEYQLPMSDLWKNEDHWDTIAIGGYPVDVQAQSVDDYGYVIAHPLEYGIPFRSLVPIGIEDLLVVGRSVGFSSLAAGSARIVATGMATGEAAGAAAALAINHNISVRELSKDKPLIEKLRSTLQHQGAYLEHFQLNYPYENEWYDKAIQTLMDYGLVVAGYENKLPIEKSLDSHPFVYSFMNLIQRANPEIYQEKTQEITDLGHFLSGESTPLTRDLAAQIISSVLVEGSNKPALHWKNLFEMGLIDSKIYEMIPNDRVLKNKEIYYIQAGLINKLKSETTF
ncbi:FAD-dependent oxidoreductase [Bacillus sp. Marseille-P3661]|uniref:FAD-dependent oxidoreductase n=1 Tax=Bacillus sp. Marseille-P3661 TaxID=1936234 RepID=UPI0015E19315|nr:FAD-dependent oxidoreductase [Bacillus sp. Marseille-P3661]